MTDTLVRELDAFTAEPELPTELGSGVVTIEEICAIADRKAPGSFLLSPKVRERVARSAGHVESLLSRDGHIYGVTTGYGDSVTRTVPKDFVEDLPLRLTRFHGCGMGRIFEPDEARAILAVRLTTLLRGWSGVSLELTELMAAMLRHDILPQIPAEGSVGASGDLTPLSYIAGALAGEREVLFNGEVMLSAEAFAMVGLKPIRLKPKEGLAVMNGTSVMTALAALAFRRAEQIVRLSSRLTSMSTLAILGNPRHFDQRLFEAKPHPGQGRVAGWIRGDLAAFAAGHTASRLQDRYSIRCAPHVIGVLEDMLPTLRQLIETELNSANDNPLFDPDSGEALHGGHFYGGHVCFAMDALKILVANVSDLMDRQLAHLVDTKFNNGLPSNLTGVQGAEQALSHGFKAVQIGVSAWTAEALKGTSPASIFSRSTECHNQDKVSMGTIAARDALRVLELTEQVAAAHALACTQAVRLRLRDGELTPEAVGAPVMAFIEENAALLPFIEHDQRLDRILTRLKCAIAACELAPDF